MHHTKHSHIPRVVRIVRMFHIWSGFQCCLGATAAQLTAIFNLIFSLAFMIALMTKYAYSKLKL